MSVRPRNHSQSFVLRLKTTNVQTISTKSKPIKECLTARNSLPTNKPMSHHNQSLYECDSDRKLECSVPTRSTNDDTHKFELQDSIVCFRKFLNDEEVRFRECHSKQELDTDNLRHTISSLSPQRRNPTIAEETEQTDSIIPQSDLLDSFYKFLSCKYDTVADRLAYCQLLLRLEQDYDRQPQSRHRHRLKFQPDFLCWYVNEWLGNMGYNSEENRKRVVRSIISFSKQESMVSVVDSCYSNIFGSYLPSKLHLMLLLEVCRQGWQYFIFFAVRFLIYVKSNLDETDTLTQQHWKRIEQLIRNQ